jgi:MalT-like TPR region
MAQILYERNELTAALDHATRGVTLCRQLAYTPPQATGLAIVARIRHAQGDPAGPLEAMGALTKALTLARRPGYVRVFADEGAPGGGYEIRQQVAGDDRGQPPRGDGPTNCRPPRPA